LRRIFAAYPEVIDDLTPDEQDLLAAYIETLPPLDRPAPSGGFTAAEIQSAAFHPDPQATRRHLKYVLQVSKRRLAASAKPAPPEHERETEPRQARDELPDLVTLDQAAAAVHVDKRTLERYKTAGTLPEPVREGGGGKTGLYDWKTMRPWLMTTFGVKLPERFPGNVR
jgi:hypothetical protein